MIAECAEAVNCVVVAVPYQIVWVFGLLLSVGLVAGGWRFVRSIIV